MSCRTNVDCKMCIGYSHGCDSKVEAIDCQFFRRDIRHYKVVVRSFNNMSKEADVNQE